MLIEAPVAEPVVGTTAHPVVVTGWVLVFAVRERVVVVAIAVGDVRVGVVGAAAEHLG